MHVSYSFFYQIPNEKLVVATPMPHYSQSILIKAFMLIGFRINFLSKYLSFCPYTQSRVQKLRHGFRLLVARPLRRLCLRCCCCCCCLDSVQVQMLIKYLMFDECVPAALWNFLFGFNLLRSRRKQEKRSMHTHSQKKKKKPKQKQKKSTVY